MRRITELFVRERWEPPQHAPDPIEGQALENLCTNYEMRLFARSPHVRVHEKWKTLFHWSSNPKSLTLRIR